MDTDTMNGQKITVIGSIIVLIGSFMPWVTVFILSFSIFDIVSMKYGNITQEFGPYIFYFLFFIFSLALLLISANLLPVSDPPRYSIISAGTIFILWAIILTTTVFGIMKYQSLTGYSIVSPGSGMVATFLGILISLIGARKWKEEELEEESRKEYETKEYLSEIAKKE